MWQTDVNPMPVGMFTWSKKSLNSCVVLSTMQYLQFRERKVLSSGCHWQSRSVVRWISMRLWPCSGDIPCNNAGGQEMPPKIPPTWTWGMFHKRFWQSAVRKFGHWQVQQRPWVWQNGAPKFHPRQAQSRPQTWQSAVQKFCHWQAQQRPWTLQNGAQKISSAAGPGIHEASFQIRQMYKLWTSLGHGDKTKRISCKKSSTNGQFGLQILQQEIEDCSVKLT